MITITRSWYRPSFKTTKKKVVATLNDCSYCGIDNEGNGSFTLTDKATGDLYEISLPARAVLNLASMLLSNVEYSGVQVKKKKTARKRK